MNEHCDRSRGQQLKRYCSYVHGTAVSSLPERYGNMPHHRHLGTPLAPVPQPQTRNQRILFSSQHLPLLQKKYDLFAVFSETAIEISLSNEISTFFHTFASCVSYTLLSCTKVSERPIIVMKAQLWSEIRHFTIK